MKYFISILTFFLIFTILISPLLPQSLLSNVGVNFGADVPVGNSQFKRAFVSPEINFYLSYHYLENFDLKFLFGYGKTVHNIQKNLLGNSILSGEVLGVYSTSVGKLLSPFFQFGFGVENIVNNTASPRTDGTIIGGFGLKIPYKADFNFLISSSLRYPFGEYYPKYFGKLSNVDFCFKSGIQVDVSSPFKKNKNNNIEKSKLLTNIKSIQSDSSLFAQLQIQKQLINHITVRDEMLMELERLIIVQNMMIDALDVQLAKVNERMQAKTIVADFQKGKMEGKNIAEKKDNPASSSLQVKILYEDALEAYNLKNYHYSISLLSKLKEKFPRHPLIGNFVYWIGESYFGLKNYKSAILSFEEVQKYRDSLKNDDAMIMIGISYFRLGDYSKANKIFQTLLNEFPNSEYKKKSKEYLALLARKIIS